MSTSIDGKQIVNTLYHAAVETALTIGYSELTKKLFKVQTPRVDFNMKDIGMLTIDIMLAVSTRDMLVKQGIIPANIMN